VTSLVFLTKIGYCLNNKIHFQRLLYLVVWYVCTGVSEELVPPSSGFLLKLLLRACYHTAGRLSSKDNNFRKHHLENLISYELNFSKFANTNDCFGSRHLYSIWEVAVVHGVTAVFETKLHLTGNIYRDIQLFFSLVVRVADCPGTVGITSELQCFACYCLWTNRINKWLKIFIVAPCIFEDSLNITHQQMQ